MSNTIGKIKLDKYGNIVEIEREWYEQGYIYKDFNGIDNPNEVCYVPELREETYTFNEIVELCDNDVDFAITIFEELNWQSPEVLIEEYIQDYEYWL